MPDLSRKLFVNWVTKKRVHSDLVPTGDGLANLVLHKYDQVPFEICIVEPDLASTNNQRMRRIPVGNLSLVVAVNDGLDSATPKAKQEVFTKNTGANTLTGSLNLNTASMNAFISDAEQDAYFEISVITSSGDSVTILSEPCKLRPRVLQTTTESPDPAQSFITIDQAKGLFASRVLRLGENISWADDSGTIYRTIGTNENGVPVDYAI
jgi:hypothetical protein